jgi:hypothetical protein
MTKEKYIFYLKEKKKKKGDETRRLVMSLLYQSGDECEGRGTSVQWSRPRFELRGIDHGVGMLCLTE